METSEGQDLDVLKGNLLDDVPLNCPQGFPYFHYHSGNVEQQNVLTASSAGIHRSGAVGVCSSNTCRENVLQLQNSCLNMRTFKNVPAA